MGDFESSFAALMWQQKLLNTNQKKSFEISSRRARIFRFIQTGSHDPRIRAMEHAGLYSRHRVTTRAQRFLS